MHVCAAVQARAQTPQFAGSVCAFTQAALQLVTQVEPQVPVVQVGRSFTLVVVHTAQATPHAELRSAGTHWPPHALKPPLQVKPQLVPLQLAVEFGGPAGHGVHEVVPHEFTSVFDTQAVPHLWKPVLHTMSHALLVQTAAPFAGTAQAMHEDPHCVALKSLAQALPHWW